MARELIQSLAKDFESYGIVIDGAECWLARDLQIPLLRQIAQIKTQAEILSSL